MGGRMRHFKCSSSADVARDIQILLQLNAIILLELSVHNLILHGILKQM